jgi:hypothetical protein
MIRPDPLVPLVTLVDEDVLDALLTEARQLARNPGDLLAEKLRGGLPEALAEAVRELLSSTNGDAPTIARRGTANDFALTSSIGIVPARRLNKGSSSDGTRT